MITVTYGFFFMIVLVAKYLYYDSTFLFMFCISKIYTIMCHACTYFTTMIIMIMCNLYVLQSMQPHAIVMFYLCKFLVCI